MIRNHVLIGGLMTSLKNIITDVPRPKTAKIPTDGKSQSIIQPVTKRKNVMKLNVKRSLPLVANIIAKKTKGFSLILIIRFHKIYCRWGWRWNIFSRSSQSDSKQGVQGDTWWDDCFTKGLINIKWIQLRILNEFLSWYWNCWTLTKEEKAHPSCSKKNKIQAC